MVVKRIANVSSARVEAEEAKFNVSLIKSSEVVFLQRINIIRGIK